MVGEEEIWSIVPPEEKLELLARSQVSGISTCFLFIAVCFTLAIALKLQWLIWLSLIASPLLFQTAAHRAWKSLKPKIMLQYLAARSVARRFAFAANAHGLEVELIFRGNVSEVHQGESQELSDAIESIESNNDETTAWVGLLNDAIVAFRESRSGGTLEFVSLSDHRLKVEGRNTDGSTDEYSKNREVFIHLEKSFGKLSTYRLTSDYPAALIVFEKKLKARVEASIKAANEEAARLKELEGKKQVIVSDPFQF